LAELVGEAVSKLVEIRLGAQHRHDVSGMSPGLSAVVFSVSGPADVAITIIQRQQLEQDQGMGTCHLNFSPCQLSIRQGAHHFVLVCLHDHNRPANTGATMDAILYINPNLVLPRELGWGQKL
jgi:hypothetical protein